MTLILGIETSCDETAASVVADGERVLSNVVASQHELHEEYRGVVPEIASRAHLERILPVVEEAMRDAGVTFEQLDAVAVGNRPGLIGSLLVGVSAAKAIAWSIGKPLIGVDHIQAHLHAAALREPSPLGRGQGEGTPSVQGASSRSNPSADGVTASLTTQQTSTSPHPNPLPEGEGAGVVFPALGLVVSGGHTSMYEVESPTSMKRLGRTIDDAIGEAYDKAAVILGVGYPGGPRLDKLAQTGDASRHDLPRSMLSPDSLDFSFSGLKTALLYKVRGHPVGRGDNAVFTRTEADLSDADRANLAAAFQHAAVDSIITKLNRALDRLRNDGRPANALIIGGGVSANSLLRTRVADLGARRGIPVRIPAMAHCVDNAAMIAGLAFYLLQSNHLDGLDLPAIATTSLS